MELFADHIAEEAPELVRRVRIILPRGERRVSGKAAQDEQSGVASCDGRQTDFDAHAETPTATPRAIERAPRRPLLGQLQLCTGWRQPGAEPPCRLPASPGRQGARLFADREGAGL